MNHDHIKSADAYPSLFSPFGIGRHTLKNRVVALPVHTGFAYPDGRPSPWMIQFYSRLARTGAAMVVVANASVSADGAVSRFNLRADTDRFIPGLAGLAKVIKQNGSLACLQLNHAGRFARTSRPLLPSPVSSSNLRFNMESLKRFMEFFPFEKRFNLTKNFLRQVKTWRQAMTLEDRERVINDFASSALRAYQADFDMVELHGANGYLLCQFLSSFTNQDASNKDDTLIKRAEFPLSVLKAVKKNLPDGFPIGFRIILREWVPGGIELEEALEFAKFLEDAGAAYLSASVGTYNSIFSPEAVKTMSRPAYLKKKMQALKAQVDIPTIASGRIIRPSIADRLIRDGVADLIGLGRPLRADPEWLKKTAGDESKINVCINCNWCLKQVVLEKGFSCTRWPEALQQRSRLEHRLLTRNYNALWVISDIRDIDIYKQCRPIIFPDKQQPSPTLVTMRAPEETAEFDDAAKAFVQWVKLRMEPLCLTDVPKDYILREEKSEWQETLANEMFSKSYGLVFMTLSPYEPWKERLIYRGRGKIFALLGGNRNRYRVVAAVDFSPATMLLMRFLKQTFMQRDNFIFTFVHVKTDSSVQVEQQWEKFKKIADFDPAVSIKVIEPVSDIASSLIAVIRQQRCGTVIMGKRGLSGIKRWLLGSVSIRVLRALTDESIFLID